MEFLRTSVLTIKSTLQKTYPLHLALIDSHNLKFHHPTSEALKSCSEQ